LTSFRPAAQRRRSLATPVSCTRCGHAAALALPSTCVRVHLTLRPHPTSATATPRLWYLRSEPHHAHGMSLACASMANCQAPCERPPNITRAPATPPSSSALWPSPPRQHHRRAPPPCLDFAVAGLGTHTPHTHVLAPAAWPSLEAESNLPPCLAAMPSPCPFLATAASLFRLVHAHGRPCARKRARWPHLPHDGTTPSCRPGHTRAPARACKATTGMRAPTCPVPCRLDLAVTLSGPSCPVARAMRSYREPSP
jgi:hypothetical protein